MSNFTTSWILELKDLVSQPAKAVKKVVAEVKDAVVKLTDVTDASEKQVKEALEQEKEHRKGVVDKIKETEKALKDLEKIKANDGWAEWQSAQHEIAKANRELDGYKKELKEADEDIAEITTKVEAFANKHKRLDFAITNWNQLSDVIGKFAKALDFSEEFKAIEGGIQLMTGASGTALAKASRDVYRLAKVYKVNGEDISATANALAENFAISFTQALDKVEDGFKKGANLSTNMLPVLKEYGPLMQEMGYGLDEVIAKMAAAGKKGLDVSRAFAALGKGGVELKKMTDAQQGALKGIGLLSEDLKGKTIKEAMEIVGAALDASGATMQEKQVLLSGLFKMQGEKMGNGLMEALFSSTQQLGDLPVVEEAGAQIKGFMADVQSWLADTMGGVAIGVQQLAPVLTGIGSAITLMQSLNKVTWIQNVATKALSVTTGVFNAVMAANPISLVVLAVSGLIGGVVLLSRKFEWAAGIVGGVKESFMDFGKVLLDVVLLPIKTIIAGVGALGKVIGALFRKDWGGAWEAAKGIATPVQDVFTGVGKAANSFGRGYTDAVKAQRDKKEKESAGVTGADDFNEVVKVDFDDKSPGPQTPKGGSKPAGGGFGITGGGGGKAFTMNLNITNNFTGKINSRQDVRELAEEVMRVVTDRGRDMALNY